MSAFAGEDMLVFSVPDEAGFTQARSGGDHGLIAGRLRVVLVGSDLVESDRVGRFQTLDSPCLRLKIVDQTYRIELQLLR